MCVFILFEDSGSLRERESVFFDSNIAKHTERNILSSFSLSHTHTHTHSLSLSLSLSHTHSPSLTSLAVGSDAFVWVPLKWLEAWIRSDPDVPAGPPDFDRLYCPHGRYVIVCLCVCVCVCLCVYVNFCFCTFLGPHPRTLPDTSPFLTPLSHSSHLRQFLALANASL